VINRNNREALLLDLSARISSWRNEKSGHAAGIRFDALLDNGPVVAVPSTGTNKRPLKVPGRHWIKGKQGRFRQNLPR